MKTIVHLGGPLSDMRPFLADACSKVGITDYVLTEVDDPAGALGRMVTISSDRPLRVVMRAANMAEDAARTHQGCLATLG